MTEVSYRGAETIDYKNADLSELQYIKIIYSDRYGEVNEIKTETNYLSDDFLSVYALKVAKIQDENEQKNPDEKKPDLSSYQSTEENEKPKSYLEYINKRKQEKEKEELELKQKEAKENEELERLNQKFHVDCPQEVILKFIIDGLLYMSKAMLENVEAKGMRVYFRTTAPKTLELQQKRKYYRIALKRLCLLVATDKEGSSSAFIARSINLSAGGVLINKLESMSDDSLITIDPEKYETYNLIIVLEMDRVMKLKAKYVREEEVKNAYRYAFEFIDVPEQKTDFISKYVIKKQLEELRGDFNSKNTL